MKSVQEPSWLSLIKHFMPQSVVRDTGGEKDGWYYSRITFFGITVWRARQLCGSYVDGFGWMIVERLPLFFSDSI